MFGQLAAGRSSGNTPSANRYFQYEIAGLRQTYETDKIGYPIRSSSSVFITVPYNRMNEEMQRITRLGGKIVNIRQLTVGDSASQTTNPPDSNVEAEADS
jgi:hypothetical protein